MIIQAHTQAQKPPSTNYDIHRAVFYQFFRLFNVAYGIKAGRV